MCTKSRLLSQAELEVLVGNTVGVRVPLRARGILAPYVPSTKGAKAFSAFGKRRAHCPFPMKSSGLMSSAAVAGSFGPTRSGRLDAVPLPRRANLRGPGWSRSPRWRAHRQSRGARDPAPPADHGPRSRAPSRIAVDVVRVRDCRRAMAKRRGNHVRRRAGFSGDRCRQPSQRLRAHYRHARRCAQPLDVIASQYRSRFLPLCLEIVRLISWGIGARPLASARRYGRSSAGTSGKVQAVPCPFRR
jgi:hypothetical protein